MLSSIEELRAKHAAELAQAEKELFIAQALPLEPVRVIAFTDHPWAIYNAVGLAGTLDVFKTYAGAARIVNMEDRKGSFRTVGPAKAKTAEDEHKGDYCAMLETSVIAPTDERGQCSAKLSFYADMGASIGVIRVTIDVGISRGYASTIGPDTYSLWAYSPQIIRNGVTDRSMVREFRANQVLYAHSDAYIHYASGSRDSAHFTYLFVADNGEECSEFTNFYSAVAAIASAFHEA